MQNIITDSLRYWELRRLVYNAVLAMVLFGAFLHEHSPAFLLKLTGGEIIGVAIAALLANVLYCSAYVADVFVQLSAFQQTWRRHRWMLFAAGTIFAAGLFLLHE